MKTAFVSGRYHKGQMVAHNAKGESVQLALSVSYVEKPAPVKEEVVIEPWIRRALDQQNGKLKGVRYVG